MNEVRELPTMMRPVSPQNYAQPHHRELRMAEENLQHTEQTLEQLKALNAIEKDRLKRMAMIGKFMTYDQMMHFASLLAKHHQGTSPEEMARTANSTFDEILAPDAGEGEV